MKISVILAFRNEEANLGELAKRIGNSLDSIQDLKFELIFIDDSSSDRSASVIRQLCSNYAITYLRLSRRFGVANSVIAGFEVATGDAVITLDCDLQDPPESLPLMIEKFKEGFDVVHMRRIKRLGENRLKLVLTFLAYRIIKSLSQFPLQTDTGDFKLYSRRAVREILKLTDTEPYLRGLSAVVGFPQATLDYVRQPRFRGRSHFSIFRSGPTREFLRAITSFSVVPLHISLWIGFFSIVVAFGIAAYSIWTKLSGLAVPGTSGTLLVVTFFSGVILMSQGILGIYVSRIFSQVRPLPRYIIEEQWTSNCP